MPLTEKEIGQARKLAFGIAVKRLRDREEAEDVASECVIRLVRRHETLPCLKYIETMALNMVIDKARRAAVRPRFVLGDEARELIDETESDRWEIDFGEPEAEAVATEGLSRDEKTMLAMRMRGESYRSIGRYFGTSQRTVMRRFLAIAARVRRNFELSSAGGGEVRDT